MNTDLNSLIENISENSLGIEGVVSSASTDTTIYGEPDLIQTIRVGGQMACLHIDGSIFIGIEDESYVTEIIMINSGMFMTRNEYRAEPVDSIEKDTVYMIVTTEKYLMFAYSNTIAQFDRNDLALKRKIKIDGVSEFGGNAFVFDLNATDLYIVCCTEKDIIQWNIETGELIRRIEFNTQGDSERVRYSNLAIVDDFFITFEFGKNDLYFWNMHTGEFAIKISIPISIHSIFKDINKEVVDRGFLYLRTNGFVYAFNSRFGEISLWGELLGQNVVPCFIYSAKRMFGFGTMDENIVEYNLKNDTIRRLIEGRDITFFSVGKIRERLFLVVGTWEGEIMIYDIDTNENKYEEDDQDFSNTISDSDSIVDYMEEDSNQKKRVQRCSNKNIMTLEDYTEEDDPIMIYMQNTRGKFEKATCVTAEELINYYKAFIGTSLPDNIMCIYTTPRNKNETGRGGNPTGKIVVKLPTNNIYVTMGSIERIMKERDNKNWYALPLFGGKRRRVGNIKGLFGSSMNHGQIPGYIIYKIYTENEIKQGVVVEEDNNDYPKFVLDNAKSLFELLAGEEKVDEAFVESLIRMITASANESHQQQA